MKKISLLFVFLMNILGIQGLLAQTPTTNPEDDIVEVSGMVIIKSKTNHKDAVPFVNVSVKGTSRGAYGNFQGMFSIVIKKGETLVFSAIGYEPQAVEIPANTEGVRKTLLVEMVATEVQLDEIVVFPWPDRDNLRAEFLAMQPDEALQWQDLAQQNLAEQRMLAIAESLGMDGSENGDYYLKMQAKDFSTMGQRPATPIFDPLAWARLFKSWKEKKKEKEDDDKE